MWTALEGITIADRYELHSHLATGGMSAVFRAWDHRLQRPVAVKILRQLEDAEPEAIERFRREARATAALRSKHIVEVYDFVEEYGCYYLVMELVEGHNLKEDIFASGRLDWHTALDVGTQICHALQVAHDKGFIHRDIKPQNILLDENGVAKLTDFGIVYAQSARSITTDGIVLGTADYVSPEQAQGLPLAPQTDLYSLGVVLYEALTGAVPYAGTTPGVVATLHVTAPIPSIREHNPAVPAEVEAVVLRALQKEPAARYASAREMGYALHAALLSSHAQMNTDEWRTIADLLRDEHQAPGVDEDNRPTTRIREARRTQPTLAADSTRKMLAGVHALVLHTRANAHYRVLVLLVTALLFILGILVLNAIR